ncbi:hypothetical protein AXF42_Ash013463 [Apostasia shenzhenica]|uniref:Endonuclease/exonuclease/phosphatase domain-containing protein n=1 Tax=Apostasia shenzhenica TaxID=1088818 RepID=A0A2I0A4A6_9ASPA|nr:hypothetical protein AXF42_Ash013463 [Apostasia shenzhenica]
MNIFVLNCRGLGGPRAVQRLKSQLRTLKPQLVFLSETKLLASEFDKVKIACMFKSAFSVSCVGRSGGLAMLWNDDFDVTLLSFSCSHIDVSVHHLSNAVAWRFTGFYGESVESRKYLSWQLLGKLAERYQGPWLCAGDFNEVLYQSEKQGGLPRDERKTIAFREVLNKCQLIDMGFIGGPFTWWNGRLGEETIVERLDRAVSNLSWQALFPNAHVDHLCSFSDHCALNIQMDKLETVSNQQRRSRFRFEPMWLRDPSCSKVVESSWRTAFKPQDRTNLLGNLAAVGKALSNWNRESFGHIQNAIQKTQKSLEHTNKLPISQDRLKEKMALQSQLNELLEREEILWKQRARVDWLKHGDRNTAYFHSTANSVRWTAQCSSVLFLICCT